MTNFSSVGTGAARLQNLSPNPQKLAGQCAKLKCCLNYEVPLYEEARKLGYSLGSTGTEEVEEPDLGYQNVVGQDDLTRFDKKKKNRNNNNNRPERRNNNRDRHDNRPHDNRRNENKNNTPPAQ
jgi:hypothetical protein